MRQRESLRWLENIERKNCRHSIVEFVNSVLLTNSPGQTLNKSTSLLSLTQCLIIGS